MKHTCKTGSVDFKSSLGSILGQKWHSNIPQWLVGRKIAIKLGGKRPLGCNQVLCSSFISPGGRCSQSAPGW